MIDIRKLKELVRLMVTNDLTEMDLRDSEEQVTLRRPSPNEAPTIMHAPMHAPMNVAAQHASPAAMTSSGGASTATDDVAVDDESDLVRVESPMVGTFYSAANPDAPPFVEAGTELKPDSVVCLIEAMKIFNEIKAECAGVVHKVLVENGEPVEFGQPLFLVKPS